MNKRLFVFLSFGLFAPACLGQVVPSGVKVTSGGLKVDSVFIVLQGEPVSLNPFPTGSKLSLSLSGIHGFSIRDNKTFPGCSMKVIDTSGKDVLDYDDLFQDYADGVDREDAKYLDVSLTLGAPLLENSRYRWSVRIWDKNGKAEMTVEVPLSVSGVKDMLGIKKVSNGLTCQNAFIMGAAPLTSNQVKVGEELDFVLTGVDGFFVQNGKVKIGARMVVRNQSGDAVLEYTDLFKDDDTYDVKEAETLRLNLKVGDPMVSGTTYLWTIRIWDKSSQKELNASCSLEVK